MKRTPDIAVEKDFTFHGEISKAFVDPKTGKRHIVGVASGVEQDRDGERVSKAAIREMCDQINRGGIKLTSAHQQDWMTEIGDAVKAHVDDETHQLVVDTELPPEGVDPIADKGWRAVNKEKVGFSVGGKLRSAFYELTDLGKKRKVLDSIGLRHLALTKKPAYEPSFAQAVAKTFEGDPPTDDEFTLDVEEVEKDLTTGSWVPGGGSNSGADSKGSGNRNAGTRDEKTKKPSTDDEDSEDNDEDDDDDKKLPESRHLACPNCGHEFAAELPADMTPDERKADEKKPDNEDSKKSTEATIMDLKKQLDDLTALVAKRSADEAPEASDDAEATEPTTVEKMVAASHAEHSERIERVEKTMGEALSLIGENLKTLNEKVGQIPMGRRSTARVLGKGDMAANEIGKTSDSDSNGVAENASAKDALMALNRDTYGIG